MSLTDEQRAIRATGIGASETAAILDLSPFASPVDVWLEKTGRGAVEKETEETVVGTVFEPALRDLYRRLTGSTTRAVGVTMTHLHHPRVKASPDGLVLDDGQRARGGTELKMVGSRMAHHWADDALPDYVELQARQCIAVLDAEWWDVVALVGGTKPRVVRVERDLEIEAIIIDACETWWENYVVTDTPPPVNDPIEARKALAARYPYKAKDKTPRLLSEEQQQDTAELFRWLTEATRKRKQLELAEDQLTNAFVELVGEDYGVKAGWGSFLWYPVQGRADWKAIAEELAGGAIPADMIERHRGEGHRVPRLYPFTPKAKRTK